MISIDGWKRSIIEALSVLCFPSIRMFCARNCNTDFDQDCMLRQSCCNNIVTCLGMCYYRRGMDWILDLLTPLGTTRNYSAAVNLHTLQITTAPAKAIPACCVLTSRSLAAASNSGYSSASRAQVLLSQPPVQSSTALSSSSVISLHFFRYIIAALPTYHCSPSEISLQSFRYNASLLATYHCSPSEISLHFFGHIIAVLPRYCYTSSSGCHHISEMLPESVALNILY
jgi:hypothetical protein